MYNGQLISMLPYAQQVPRESRTMKAVVKRDGGTWGLNAGWLVPMYVVNKAIIARMITYAGMVLMQICALAK